MKKFLLITILFLLITSASFAQELPREQTSPQERLTTQHNALFDEEGKTTVLVRLKKEPLQAQRMSIQQRREDFIQEKKPVYTFSDQQSFTLRVTQEEIEELQNNPLVEEIILGQPIFTQLSNATSIIRANDTWALATFGTNLTGKGQTICIIDTGVDYTHPDLGGCVGEGCKVLAAFNAIDGTTNVTDVDGHGTHVAGIAAANGVVKGSAPDANIVAIKALPDTGPGSSVDVAAGIDWCVNNAATYNITIISMSLGTDTVYTSACDNNFLDMRDAIHAAAEKNLTVLAASGNSGFTNAISAPACISKTIPVGSTTKNDEISGFSNLNSLVKLLAPGSNINATIPDNSYGIKSGTSMATPHVAGAFAILQQQLLLTNQQRSAQEIESILFENRGATLEEEANTYGRIDVWAAIADLKQFPETSATFSQGWQKKVFNVTLNVTFNNTAINYTTYRVNEQPWENGTTILIEEEGNHTVEFYSVDVAGNIEPTNTIYALLDLTAPNTTSNESSSWEQETTIFLNATDNLSGTNYTTHKVDEGPWVNNTNIFFNTTGNYTVSFFSVDNAGNIETTKNATVLIDNTAPTIFLEQSNNWQNNTFIINWTVIDEHSGVQNITYQKNNETIQEGTNLTIEQEGNHTITITASDNANNTRTISTQALLDLTAPHTTITNEVLGWQNTNVTLLFNATDNLSGVNYTSVRVNEELWVNTTNVTVSEEGNNTIHFFSVDRAGNIETTKNFTVLIDKTNPIIHNITINETIIRTNNSFSIIVNASDENLANVTITILEDTQEMIVQEDLFTTNQTLVSGTYNAIIRATDSATNEAINSINFTVYDLAKRTNQAFNNTNNTIIDERETTKTIITIRTQNNVTGNLTLLSTPQRPSMIPTNLNNAVRFVTIQLSENVREEINWSILEVYYEEEDITGLNESSLDLQYYNETSQEWQTLDELSFINDYGLDIANKRVWMNTTRFSTYALSGEEPVSPPPSTPPTTGGSSGGGGGGGGGGAAAVSTSSNSSTQSVSFLSEGNPVTIRFHNELLSIKQVVFTPTNDRFSATLTLEKKAIPQDVPTNTKEYYELTYPQDLEVTNVTITYTTNIDNPIFYRYTNKNWIVLAQETITNNTYEALSEGFSRFAIASQELVVEELFVEEMSEELVVEEIIQENPMDTLVDSTGSVQEISSEKNPLTITLLLLTLSFVLGFIFFVKKIK